MTAQPDPSSSLLKLSDDEKREWTSFGTGSRFVVLHESELQHILQSSAPELKALRDRLPDLLDATPLDRDAFILARRGSKDGEREIDSTTTIAMGDDNGAYVQSWVWQSFIDTELDQEREEETPVQPERPAR